MITSEIFEFARNLFACIGVFFAILLTVGIFLLYYTYYKEKRNKIEAYKEWLKTRDK